MSTGIVFVHLGSSIPIHLRAAIGQARLFTRHPIYLIANRRALRWFRSGVDHVPVAAEDLAMPPSHEKFRKITKEAKRGDFLWTRATERFFYIAALVQELGLENVIHLESDNMLYADHDALASKLAPLYPAIGAPFMDDGRAIASFVFVREAAAMARLSSFIADNVGGAPTNTTNDMSLLFSAYELDGPSTLQPLPVLPLNDGQELRSRNGSRPRNPSLYTQHVEALGIVFDAAALGQYLGGLDNRPQWYRPFRRPDPNRQPGFLNEFGYVDPSRFKIEWTRDEMGRFVPQIVDDINATPVANLHIHSKNLGMFSSLGLNLPLITGLTTQDLKTGELSS